MALKATYDIRCGCGGAFTAEAWEYLLAEHDPKLKDAVLSGEFNRVACPSCGHALSVGNDFFYRDETNGLSVWVCCREEGPGGEGRKKELLEKLRARLECHYTDGASPGKELLVFGREALVALLLREDPALRKSEGGPLKRNEAVRLAIEGDDDPGYLLLRGRKIRVAIPLRFPENPVVPSDDQGTRRKWLKAYSDGLNIHNPYSSLLDKRRKAGWNKVREEEPPENAMDEFDDFAASWAHGKVDAAGFRARYPKRRKFIDGLAEMDVPRKVRGLRAGRPGGSPTPGPRQRSSCSASPRPPLRRTRPAKRSGPAGSGRSGG